MDEVTPEAPPPEKPNRRYMVWFMMVGTYGPLWGVVALGTAVERMAAISGLISITTVAVGAYFAAKAMPATATAWKSASTTPIATTPVASAKPVPPPDTGGQARV